ncbi:MAG: B12-binding domain-containing radical SAM protein [Vicinamibacterales bacterium]
MRVLLVAPTALDSYGRPIKQRRVHIPGLTLQMLAAVTPPDVDLTLVGETTGTIPFDEPWDLVGLTGMGSGLVRAWQIAGEFRKRGRKVVIGGIAASLAPPALTLAHADSVVIGEAEEIWPRVVRDAQAGRLQPIYRMASQPDVAHLPDPRYDLMTGPGFGRWSPVQATRGCPFTCTFCSVTAFFRQGYRKRPVASVLRDVRAAKRIRRSRYVAFIDDNIGVDWDYCRELWEALIPERIIWMSQCSLHIADRPDMLALARRSGCRMLSFGIETTNAASLAAVDKAWNRPERYAAAVRTIREHGIDISTEMMVGLDEDDESTFDGTHAFIMDNRISVPRVHILTPIPGTPFYDQVRAEGRILSEDFTQYSGGRIVFKPRKMDPDRLQMKFWQMYDRLYSWKAIAHRVGRNHARLEAYMSAFVFGVNLHYRAHIQRRITPGIV